MVLMLSTAPLLPETRGGISEASSSRPGQTRHAGPGPLSHVIVHLPGVPIWEGTDPLTSSMEKPHTGPRLAAGSCPEMLWGSPKSDACPSPPQGAADRQYRTHVTCNPENTGPERWNSDIIACLHAVARPQCNQRRAPDKGLG